MSPLKDAPPTGGPWLPPRARAPRPPPPPRGGGAYSDALATRRQIRRPLQGRKSSQERPCSYPSHGECPPWNVSRSIGRCLASRGGSDGRHADGGKTASRRTILHGKGSPHPGDDMAGRGATPPPR